MFSDHVRVVVTGVGAVTPISHTLEEYRKSLATGRSGVGPISLFDCSIADPVTGEPQFATRIAAEVKDFKPELHLRKPQRYDRASQFGICAARMAVQDAGLSLEELKSASTGAFIGTAVGDMQTIETAMTVLHSRGARRLLPTYLPKVLPSTLVANLCVDLGTQGPSMGISSACASSTHAVGEAYWCIHRGDAEKMVAGGADASITPLTVGSFTAMRAMSRRNESPATASRPFDRERDGFVIGEGAGLLILESLESAKRRGAKIYAEIVGYGATADAYHLTDMNPELAQCAHAMRKALKRARINPERIDYINAHGTSTPTNDAVETIAIKEVFGSRAYKIPISSTKSMIGHLMGASGGAELVAVILGLQDQTVHPTINLRNADPACDLDYVSDGARPHPMEYALKNSFGMGGHNASLVLRHWRD
jgi:3-oxoacyl-[acyl-carrier-protein] synthase II